jgi:hypothetical protein
MERACKSLTWFLMAAAAAALSLALCSPGSAQDQQDQQEQPAQPQKPAEPGPGADGQGEPAKPAAEPQGGEKPEDTAQTGEETKDKEEEAPPKPTKEQIEKAYPVGERLTYDVSWAGIHAGTAVMEVNDKVRYKGRECFRIRSYTTSAGAISAIYKVDDKLQTYVDAETLEPARSDKRLSEGGYSKEEYVIYSAADRTAKYYKKSDGKYELRREHTEVPCAVQGALSSIYYIRTLDLELGKSYEIYVLTGRRITKGVFQVTERKALKISGVGDFIALRISPQYIEMPGEGKMKPGEGLFVASGDSEVWVDEATGIPLLMIVDIPVGSIKVELTKKEMVKKEE